MSSGVARKQYSEFSDNIDLIDTLPPGLYEATFTKRSDDVVSPDLVSGDWVMRCEMRTLDDIRALGGNDAEDERRFAAAARVSETNLALYRTYMQPFVRACRQSDDGGVDAQHASAAPAIRDVLRCQSVHGADQGGCGEGAQERKPGGSRQPIPRHAGEYVAPDRGWRSMSGAA